MFSHLLIDTNLEHAIYALQILERNYKKIFTMHDKQQQNEQNQPRSATTDRPYNRCRIRHPMFLTAGPPIPMQVFSQTCKFAASMSAGHHKKRPTWVLGLRVTDTATQKLASRVVRGDIEPLRDAHETFLQFQQTDRLQKCKADSIFKLIKESYPLEAGRPWKLWAYRHMRDPCPVALASVEDVLLFLKKKLEELSAGTAQTTPAMHLGLPPGVDYESSRLIMQFVVEVSPTWPKLFGLADKSEVGEEEEEEDQEEAMIRIEMERLRLEYRGAAEQEARAAEQKKIEAREKALVRLNGEKKAEKKEKKKKESTTKVSSSRREAQRKVEEKKETDRKDREKKRAERAKKEEEERKQAEKERKEKEKARLRRIEKEEEEKKQQRIAERQRREKEREKTREQELEERDKKAKRDQEREKDRAKERSDKRKGLVLAHGQISVGKVTPAPKPSLRKLGF